MAPDAMNLGDRREPVGLGNSVGSDVDAALTFKAVHGRVVNEPPDRAARERELGVHRNSTAWIARKPIRRKRFTRKFHCHRDFPASAYDAWRPVGNYVGRAIAINTGVRLSNGRRYM